MTTLAGWGGRIPAANADSGVTAHDTSMQKEKAMIPRPFRVPLSGAVLVLVRLPNGRELRASLQVLSISGGLIHIKKPLDEKIRVDLLFHVDQATIRARGQMLFPTWAANGWLQPFRFVDLPEATRKELEANLKSFLEAVSGPAAWQ
jgi:hypothetical protein